MPSRTSNVKCSIVTSLPRQPCHGLPCQYTITKPSHGTQADPNSRQTPLSAYAEAKYVRHSGIEARKLIVMKFDKFTFQRRATVCGTAVVRASALMFYCLDFLSNSSTLLKRGPSIGQTQTPGSVSLLTSPAVSDISTTSSAKLRSASQSLAEAKAERDAIKNAIKSKDEKRRMNKAESANARAIAMQVWKVEEERKQVERDQRLLLEKLEYEKMAEQHTQSVAERQRGMLLRLFCSEILRLNSRALDFGQQVQRQAAEMRASHGMIKLEGPNT